MIENNVNTIYMEERSVMTFVSISRSRRSFMVHPAPLKSKAPHPNRVNILKSGSWPGGAAKVIDLKNTIYSSYGFWKSCSPQHLWSSRECEHRLITYMIQKKIIVQYVEGNKVNQWQTFLFTSCNWTHVPTKIRNYITIVRSFMNNQVKFKDSACEMKYMKIFLHRTMQVITKLACLH